MHAQQIPFLQFLGIVCNNMCHEVFFCGLSCVGVGRQSDAQTHGFARHTPTHNSLYLALCLAVHMVLKSDSNY